MSLRRNTIFGLGIIPELSRNYLGIIPELSRNYLGIISAGPTIWDLCLGPRTPHGISLASKRPPFLEPARATDRAPKRGLFWYPFSGRRNPGNCAHPKRGVEIDARIWTLPQPSSPLNLTIVVYLARVRTPWPGLKERLILGRFGSHLF